MRPSNPIKRVALMCFASAYAFCSDASAATVQQVIPLYSADAPGSEHSTQKEIRETLMGEARVRNVTQPTLTVYLPPKSKATGTAVIVAPGGGFMMLSIESEGEQVAKWLTDHGIAAFLLKYRLNETPAADADFQKEFLKLLQPKPAGESVRSIETTAGAQLAMADGLEAVSVVRTRAGEWHVSADHIGFLGFSAGAVVAMTVATAYEPGGRPDFVASIYGAMPAGHEPPSDAPPLFLAVAADDPLLAGASAPIFAAWQAKQRPAELHVFQKGGHGFGMNRTGNSSDHWMDEFYWWLQSGGIVKSAR